MVRLLGQLWLNTEYDKFVNITPTPHIEEICFRFEIGLIRGAHIRNGWLRVRNIRNVKSRSLE